MMHESKPLFLNRDHAAQFLISILNSYKNGNCLIVAISNGATVIASHIARRLNADLVFMPSKTINDTTDPLKSIGVVSYNYSTTDDLLRDIPQEYIYRKTRALQSELLSRYPDVLSSIDSKFQNRTIILVDDLAQTSDEILACLRAIRKQQPKEIIVAVPVITQRAAHAVMEEADSFMFVHVVPDDSIKGTYMDFNIVTDAEVPRLMALSIKEIIENKLKSHN